MVEHEVAAVSEQQAGSATDRRINILDRRSGHVQVPLTI